jgi:hypothetical protein
MGESRMVPLNASAFIAITGNGLTVSEDLVRRFISVDLDAGMEDPESRPFKGDFLADVMASRTRLLTAALTVWRWGRQYPALPTGAPLGSYGRWTQWVRDPLLALGCADPVLRIAEAKASDTRRQNLAELLEVWHERHHDYPMKAADLHADVRVLLDPTGRATRQSTTAHLAKLKGTRIAGFTLTAIAPSGKWGTTTYAVTKVSGPAGKHEVAL